MNHTMRCISYTVRLFTTEEDRLHSELFLQFALGWIFYPRRCSARSKQY